MRPGSKLQSDVEIGTLHFASYRNKNIGSRGIFAGETRITLKMLANLRQTPFYRAINLRRSVSGLPASFPK